ncbi:MAG: nucleoside triphosphate pyrophosphohydrolase family protein [Bacteroidota bacterium]
MQEPNPLNQVAEFHRTFKHPIQKEPTIPSSNRSNLRVSLLAEELQELKEAIEDRNLIEIADALCDLQYVLSGAILEFGLGDKFKDLFDEVHRSNMSKACKTIEEANDTIQHYRENHQCDAYHQEEGPLFLVYRKNDNKTLKSIDYSPADLASILK